MNEYCGLCRKKSKLLNSHIIPKFFYKFIKKNSPTGYIRFSVNPNKREQDGIKYNLLCTECEQRFSKYEKYFHTHIFERFPDIKQNQIDTNQLTYFALSLFWRAGAYNIFYNPDKIINEVLKFTNKELEAIKQELEKWRILLLHEDLNAINSNKMYILPIDNVEIYQEIKYKLEVSRRPNDMYSKRSIFVDLKTTDRHNEFQECYIYIVVPKFLFLINLFGTKEINYLSRYEINKGIRINDSMITLDEKLSDLLKMSYDEFLKSDNAISPQQREKIISDTLRNIDKLKEL